MGLDERGLTLIEVVVAAAVVLVVVVAASNAIAVVGGATARADGRAAAEAAAASQIEELSSLPFVTAGSARPSATDVVSSVFPHADTQRNSPDAMFAPESRAGCPAGTFFTVKSAAAGRMTIAATFVVGTAAGWAPVPGARLAGYDAQRSSELPSAALLVQISVAWRAGARAGTIVRSAILSDPLGGPRRIAEPTPSVAA
jgi:prepilin-type N-terminal cleavage/methylation domain-containing protein